MFTGSVIGAFGKTANELFEYQTHVMVRDNFRPKVSPFDLLHCFVEQIRIAQLSNEFAKFKVLEDFAGVFGKALDIVFKVVLDAVGSKRRKVHLRRCRTTK